MKLLNMKVLLLGYIAIPLIVLAQDDIGNIGGYTSDNSSNIEEFRRITGDAARNAEQNRRNNLTSAELETFVLIRAPRAMEADSNPLSISISGIFDLVELDILKAELRDALDFAVKTTATRKDSMCEVWNTSKATNADAMEMSLGAYRDEDLRIQPLINARFQNVLDSIARDIGPEKASEFYNSLEPMRSRYAAANSTNFADFIRSSENGSSRLESLCN
ncbi:MAG: hypothetical protein WDZ52_06970 [Pseudohongiellaceae bacterium]